MCQIRLSSISPVHAISNLFSRVTQNFKSDITKRYRNLFMTQGAWILSVTTIVYPPYCVVVAVVTAYMKTIFILIFRPLATP